MATKRLLVDAIHPEETRIVVTSGNRLEEFDFESATRRQLRGNIYLAKVTRVEPSLQAAFVEYGGNRHGFLAFSEIHPDYYQIPVADREALLRAEEEAEANDEAEAEAEHADAAAQTPEAPTEAAAESDPQSTEGEDHDDGHIEQAPANAEPIESVGGGDALEEAPRRKPSVSRRNNYKIQEVIKRRQVMLVQVVKEERGNKGAALTTYLSLAGRYSVLMPNTARGGGISRKITNATDRKRLKDIVGDLEVPPGQGIILRTAGASRTKAEVKRDFEYLQRLWENVRSLTLKSVAPCLVYEEGSLIKRTIRDLYNKDIEEVLVAGDDAYREAKDFMRMIMPSHAKNVQLYKEDQPVFSKFGVESQLDSMFSPQVTLPSGGYIVINPTEALVSIDVNSGRSTREHNIEDTALQTNLEAAEEVSRQLRLRDLAGLIVIDFIDMMENRSNRAVERKLKDCLKNDRARIQVGRISHFGLMEMSRQRIRFGVVESSTHKCPVCDGTGIVRSVESIALLVMRAVEDHVLRKPGQSINVKVPTDVALYILNSKRMTLNALEAKYDLSITILADDHIPGAHYQIERGEARVHHHGADAGATHVRVDSALMDDNAADAADAAVEDEEESEEEETVGANGDAGAGGDRQGRRRRRRGRGRDRDRSEARPQSPPQRVAPQGESPDEDAEAADGEDGEVPQRAEGAGTENGEEPRRRRRRGRRGGRRNRRGENGDVVLAPHGDADAGTTEEEAAPAPIVSEEVTAAVLAQDAIAEASGIEPEVTAAAEKPRRARRSRRSDAPIADASETAEAAVEATAEAEPAARPKSRRRTKAAPPTEEAAIASAHELVDASAGSAAPTPAAEEQKPARRQRELPPPDAIVVSSSAAANEEKPKKAGWWQRRLGLG